MVVHVLVAERQAQDALSHDLLDGVLDAAWGAVIREALSEAAQDPALALHFAEQQDTRIRGDIAAVETGDKVTVTRSLGVKRSGSTLCHRSRWAWI